MAIVNLNYGHNGTGKLYSYYDQKGTRRAGDVVVVEVTNRQGHTYKTLGIIRSTHGTGTVGERDTQAYLDNKENNEGTKGISLKPVIGGSKEDLPGYDRFKDEKAPSAAWERDSDRRYDDALKTRLLRMEV